MGPKRKIRGLKSISSIESTSSILILDSNQQPAARIRCWFVGGMKMLIRKRALLPIVPLLAACGNKNNTAEPATTSQGGGGQTSSAAQTANNANPQTPAAGQSGKQSEPALKQRASTSAQPVTIPA